MRAELADFSNHSLLTLIRQFHEINSENKISDSFRLTLKKTRHHHSCQFQKNSPLALPKSTSLPFNDITPPFREHFHLFFARVTLSNWASARLLVWTSTPCKPAEWDTVLTSPRLLDVCPFCRTLGFFITVRTQCFTTIYSGIQLSSDLSCRNKHIQTGTGLFSCFIQWCLATVCVCTTSLLVTTVKGFHYFDVEVSHLRRESLLQWLLPPLRTCLLSVSPLVSLLGPRNSPAHASSTRSE